MNVIKNSVTFLFIVSVIIGISYSCSSICDSQITENRTVKLGLFQIKNKLLVDSVINKVFVSIQKDTFLYYKFATSNLSLELNQQRDTSVFYFKKDTVTSDTIDTLIFTYHRSVQLISSECGFNSVFTSLKFDKYTRNIIDTVIQVSTDVNSDVHLNYKLVLRPKPILKSKSWRTR